MASAKDNFELCPACTVIVYETMPLQRAADVRSARLVGYNRHWQFLVSVGAQFLKYVSC